MQQYSGYFLALLLTITAGRFRYNMGHSKYYNSEELQELSIVLEFLHVSLKLYSIIHALLPVQSLEIIHDNAQGTNHK